MSNKNLEEWLHSNIEGEQQLKILNFKQRLNIAIDVAFGLEYLHCFCETRIVHCDLMPRNILLDEDMVAHVGDFGLARFILEATDNVPQSLSLSSGLKGTIGYIPPEYSMGGQVSTHGDMYSYGIVLLEMFTGKRPTDDMFRDGLSLCNFVTRSTADHLLEIIDPLLILDLQKEFENQENDNENEMDEEASELRRRNMEIKIEECLRSVITIGLSCCAPLPKDRMEVYEITGLISMMCFNGYEKLTKLQKIEWKNRGFSTFHAFVVAVGSLYLLLLSDIFKGSSQDDPITKRNSILSDTMLGVSLGYFLFDLGMIFWHFPSLGGMEYVLHHSLSMFSISLSLISGEAQFYILTVLFSETTTPFVNLRWYLDVAKKKNSKLYLCNGIAMFLGWLVARIFLFIFFFVHMYLHFDQVKEVFPFGLYSLLSVPPVLAVMNVFWFWKIAKGLIKTLSKIRHAQ